MDCSFLNIGDLERKCESYKDTVQFKFTDTYHNLSLKAYSWFNWAAKYWPNAKYILKVDDDMYKEMRVQRREEDKWYVSYEEFNETVFPRFCSGSSYCLTTQAVQPLLDSVELTPFLWLDDVYITGLLSNIQPT
ncbi:Galactosyl T domain containing protein [Trichuris trichiura]|uniref:Hexosyltransferase n=1 Tax=Trichuris trichiura TaxID=36087 RepID=A0A077ZDC4_TRITR|nr:Galactosyl T domain containing protein [Trichuris trichiura]